MTFFLKDSVSTDLSPPLRPMNFHLFGDRICPGRIRVGARTICGPMGSDARMVGGAWAAFGSRGILFAAHPVLASRRLIPLGPHSGRGTHLLRPNGFRCPNGWRGLGRIGAHRAGYASCSSRVVTMRPPEMAASAARTAMPVQRMTWLPPLPSAVMAAVG